MGAFSQCIFQRELGAVYNSRYSDLVAIPEIENDIDTGMPSRQKSIDIGLDLNTPTQFKTRSE